MDDRIKDIIESGLLESYLLGQCTPEEEQEIDALLENSEALQDYLAELEQFQLDITEKIAVQPPAELKQKIKEAIESDSESSSSVNNTKKEAKTGSKWSSIFLLGALLLSIFMLLNSVTRNLELRREIQRVNILNMQHDDHTEELNQLIDTLQLRLQLLMDTNTKKHTIETLTNNGPLKVFAYWNETEKSSLLMLASLPELPQDQCLQMWADVKGEMKNIGVLKKSTGLMAIPYLAEAESLNITVEPDGGSDHPTVENLIASTTI